MQTLYFNFKTALFVRMRGGDSLSRGHKRIVLSNGKVLNLDCCNDYMTIYIYQSSLSYIYE